MPSSWYYLCYYPPVDYSNMYFFAGIVICIWIHIWFNILLHTQIIMHYKGRL
jgi:hypothetical protein